MAQSLLKLEDTIDELDKDFHLVFSTETRLIIINNGYISHEPFKSANKIIENEYILTD